MSSPHPEESQQPNRATWRGLLIGAFLLAITWLGAALLEPYLVDASVQSADPSVIRVNAPAWANSNIWLLSQVLALAICIAAGFASKWWSQPKSWTAPLVLLVIVLGYIFFGQFPATSAAWRIALWSLGLPASFLFGAWLGARWQSAA